MTHIQCFLESLNVDGQILVQFSLQIFYGTPELAYLLIQPILLFLLSSKSHRKHGERGSYATPAMVLPAALRG